MTRVNGSVDGRNLAMNGKAARQAVARGAAAQIAGSASASCEQQAARSAQALAAGSKLGDKLLQKVNGNLKAWHGHKLTHGVGVISAGGNVRAR